ncbi:MAG TPA: TolC family protein [Nevskiaceae bacterium]|nr:TolC family protein [Nevskiaceae bacterium]
MRLITGRLSSPLGRRGLLVLLLLAGGPAAALDEASTDPLPGYLAEALTRNHSLQAQQFEVRAAAAALAGARAKRAPVLALAARYTVSEGGRFTEIPTGDLVNPIYQTLNQLTAESENPTRFPMIDNSRITFLREREQDTRLTLSLPLYAPQIGSQIRLQAALLDSREAQREAFARTLVRDLRQAYYTLGQAEAGQRILQASLDTLIENQRVAEALLSSGQATRDRVLRAEAEVLAVTQRLQVAENQVRQARRYLNLLRNAEEEAPVRVSVPLDAVPAPAVPASASAEGAQRRPELRQAEAGIRAAEQAAELARDRYQPTLALAADSGYQGETYRHQRDAEVHTASLVLSWTLFDGGQRRSAVDEALGQAQALRARREELARALDLARRRSEDELRTAESALETAGARLRAASESFRIAQRQRDAGQRSQLEFLDAERARTEAELGFAVAGFDRLRAEAELEYATAAFVLPPALLARSLP